jgi:hypothetical protein
VVSVAASPGAAAEEALMSGGNASGSDAEVEADIVGGIEEQVYEQDALALVEYELQEPDMDFGLQEPNLDFQEPGGDPREPKGAWVSS